ncbi:MAG: hypothetical protein GY858_06080 [Candidatus Omnitrophica bacterium]|nr:hypothetical protein [Candidatus Omnitrophota bacterium]
MFLRKQRKSQSILEYALLLGVIVAAILIMQTFVKRGFQGRMKDSADRIGGGETFSTSDTAIISTNTMTSDQVIVDVKGTAGADGAMHGLLTDAIGAKLADQAVVDIVGKGAAAANARFGGDMTSETLQKTSDATSEAYRQADYTEAVVEDFEDDDIIDAFGD